MSKELVGSLPIIVQLFLGVIALISVLLLARNILRRLGNAIRARMPQPFLGGGSNIDWAEQKRAEIASGLHSHAEVVSFSDGEWSKQSERVMEGQSTPAAAPTRDRSESEDSLSESSRGEVNVMTTQSGPAIADYDDYLAERILKGR